MAVSEESKSLLNCHRRIERFTNQVFIAYLHDRKAAIAEAMVTKARIKYVALKGVAKDQVQGLSDDERWLKKKAMRTKLKEKKEIYLEAVEKKNKSHKSARASEKKAKKAVKFFTKVGKGRKMARLPTDLPLTQLELVRSVFYIEETCGSKTRWVRGLTLDTKIQKKTF